MSFQMMAEENILGTTATRNMDDIKKPGGSCKNTEESMTTIKYRHYPKGSLLSTEPILEGFVPTKGNLEILDYCDTHGLDALKATIQDAKGNATLRPNHMDFKESDSEIEKNRLMFQMVSDPEIYDNPVKLAHIKKRIAQQ